MDRQFMELAKVNFALYSRYADDITFSTSEPHFPPGIATFDNSVNKVHLSTELADVVLGNGFQINELKVRLQNRNSRQEVTGLIVNVRPNVRRGFIRQLRAMLHDWEVNDLQVAEARYREKYCKYRLPDKRPPSFKAVIRGKINYLGMVRGKDDGLYKHFRQRFYTLNSRSFIMSHTP